MRERWAALTVVTGVVLVLILVATSISTSRFRARERRASAAFTSGVTTLTANASNMLAVLVRTGGTCVDEHRRAEAELAAATRGRQADGERTAGG